MAVSEKDVGRIDEALDVLGSLQREAKELSERKDGPKPDTRKQAERTASAAETLANNYKDLKRIIESDEDIYP